MPSPVRCKKIFFATEFTVLFFNAGVSLIRSFGLLLFSLFIMFQAETLTLAGVQKDSEVSVAQQVQTGPEVSVASQAQTASKVSSFRRAIELWPYVFIVVSVTGLAYIALNSSR